jgi:hypothetical protein
VSRNNRPKTENAAACGQQGASRENTSLFDCRATPLAVRSSGRIGLVICDTLCSSRSHHQGRTIAIVNFSSRASLRQLLTVPFVVLMLVTATVIGALSYAAGRNAVDTLSSNLLHETVNRIAQAIDKHISGAAAVLETSFPENLPANPSVEQDLDSLRTRLWLATSIQMDPNNYAYFGNRHGQFIGLWRFSRTDAELRLRLDPRQRRSIYHYSGIDGALDEPVLESRVFDPLERPWYQAGQLVNEQTWTPIYVDFKSLELVVTRAKRVNNLAGEFEGVVATDVSLRDLNTFLKKLTLSSNGIAFIVEADGKLVAVSRGPYLREGLENTNTRLNAASIGDPLIAATYQAVSATTPQGAGETATRTT